MTVFATGGRARTLDFETGDVGYVQRTLPHYIENTGSTDLKFLEMFKSSYFQDLSLSEWLTHTPPELVMAHLNIDRKSTRFNAARSDRGGTGLAGSSADRRASTCSDYGHAVGIARTENRSLRAKFAAGVRHEKSLQLSANLFVSSAI